MVTRFEFPFGEMRFQSKIWECRHRVQSPDLEVFDDYPNAH